MPMNLAAGVNNTIDTGGYRVTLADRPCRVRQFDEDRQRCPAFSGSNSYTGPTTISQGKLTVDGSLTNSAFSVNGGTLGGTGYLTSARSTPAEIWPRAMHRALCT